jgi:MFS transporter, DHA1 family, tetracycline resistance protein
MRSDRGREVPRVINRSLILCTVFFDALGYGLLLPVLPDVVRRFDSDPSSVSRTFGYFIVVYAVVQFVAAPVLGNLSDRYGRRPILLASLAGAAIDYLLMAYAPTLSLLLVGRIISGLTGASMAVAYAYMADISDERSRPENLGLVAAALGVGLVAGPGVGGALAQAGLSAPFLAAAGFNFLNFAVALVFLPESLGAGARRRLDFARWTPLVSLRPLFRASPLTRLFWCFLLLSLAGRATSSMWALFTAQRFAWSSVEIGASFAFMGLVMAIAQGALPRVLLKRLGDARALRMGLLLSAATYAAITFTTRGWQLYVIVAMSAFSAVAVPVLQSCMSRAVPPNAQGELQGSLASIASLSAIAGPLVYTNVFAHGIVVSRNELIMGAPFLVAAAFSLVAWLLAGRREVPRKTQPMPTALAKRTIDGLEGGSTWTRMDG